MCKITYFMLKKIFRYIESRDLERIYNFAYSNKFNSQNKNILIFDLDSKISTCHVERSETTLKDSKRDFSSSLKMTSKHKTTKMLFPKMTK